MKVKIQQNKKRKGFTMIELIIVIAILAILSVGAALAYGNLSGEAKKSADNANAATIARALNTYNALAATPKTETFIPTSANLAALETKTTNTPADLISMNLGVTITSDELKRITAGTAEHYHLKYENGSWIVATGSGTPLSPSA